MNILKYLIILFIGTIIGIIATKNQAFIIMMKKINWSGLTFWFSLFLGATIPIIINYFSMKRQEVIKLKAKLAQDKVNIIREYKAFDFFMRTTMILDKTITDLEFDYEPTLQDKSAPTLRGLIILDSHESYNEWKTNNMMFLEKLNGIGSKEISDYIWLIQNYLLNLDILIEKIPDHKMWNVSVALKNDFIDLSNEFSNIIDKYMDNTLFKFKNDYSNQNNNIQKVTKKLNSTNLMKYKGKLMNLA